MNRRFPLISERLPAFLHGADYNPEQWPANVWDEDMRLMKLANVNVATVGVFSWVSIQPAPHQFEFEWLDTIMDKLEANGIYAVLATPSAAHPAWLSRAHPEVLRSDETGRRRSHGGRMNFCPNSQIYREASAEIARRLAERYRERRALILWHVGNELAGRCYCDTCAEAFREWLRDRYGTLDELNAAWYTSFWGQTYTAWSQINPAYVNGGRSIPALNVDYERFGSDSLLGCFVNEATVLREVTPDIPVTTNLMALTRHVNYRNWAPHMDVVSWDNYPSNRTDKAHVAFCHDLMYGLKERPFLLMEQTPSSQNWQPVNALKRPGQMRLWSYQAVAHGSDSVMYFQWRRSRGGHEKLHGAIVEHVGHGDTRVFGEISELGAELQKLSDVLGAGIDSRVALIYDWENRWALEYTSGPLREKRYVETVLKHYRALWERNIQVAVVSMDADLSDYDIVIAPMLYMTPGDWATRATEFVRAGGRLVATCMTGYVDERDLAYLNGYPGPLREVLGIWVEEIDALFDGQQNRIIMKQPFGPCRGEYTCGRLCDLMHAESASVLATYGMEFYAGWPVVTENRFGEGCAYYIGTDPQPQFLAHFYRTLCADAGISPVLSAPEGVEVCRRSQNDRSFILILNHNEDLSYVDIGEQTCRDLLTDREVTGSIPVRGQNIMVLEERADSYADADSAVEDPPIPSEEPAAEHGGDV
jgi:beta-galactosidase